MTPWRWLLWRASVVIVRTPAYWAAAAAHAAILAAFLLVWGDGLPTLTKSVLEQIAAVQWTALSVLLPWAAARCGSRSRIVTTRFAVLTAQLPSSLLLSRGVALFIALGVCTLCGLPMLILAQQISALPPAAVISHMLRLAPMIGFVAVLTTWCDVLIPDRMLAWLVAAGATLLTVLLPEDTRLLALAAGTIAGAAACFAADPLLRYLPDRLPRATS